MKAIEEELNKNIKGANKLLNNNPDIKLLYTQKEGVRFLINNINSKTKQLRKSIKETMLELLKEGYFDKVLVYGNKDEVEDIINEISDNGSNNNKSTVKFSYNDWQVHKLNPYNDLTGYINDFAKLVIELGYAPQELSILLDRIDKIPAMTFDEEANILFEEENIILVEKCDKVHMYVGNEAVNGVTEKNIEYQDDWELLLCWVVSEIFSCRFILNGLDKNISIIGLDYNVNKTVEHFESFSKEIMNLGMRKYSAFLNGYNIDADMIESINTEIKKFGKKTTLQENYIENYLFDVVAGVKKKMDDQAFERAKSNSESGLMVVGQKDLVDEYVRKNYPNRSYVRIKVEKELKKRFHILYDLAMVKR